MTTFTLFTATTSGLVSNTHYPNRVTITDASDLEAAARFDHVAAEYQGNQRSTHGFISSNCLVMDIDNDHTENPRRVGDPAGAGGPAGGCGVHDRDVPQPQHLQAWNTS